MKAPTTIRAEFVELAQRFADQSQITDSPDAEFFGDGANRLSWIGYLGEILVCLELGLDPIQTLQAGQPDGGVDLVYKGLRVQVRTRLRNQVPDLLWRDRPGAAFLGRCDLVVLVWIHATARHADQEHLRWTIVGWESSERLQLGIEFGRVYLKNFGHGDTWVVRSGLLRPFEELVSWTGRKESA